MAWTSWLTRVDTLPQILAGPILRRVDADAVSVWVAMRTPFTVTLRVFLETSDSVHLIGTRPSIRIANNLHIAVITASPAPPLIGLSPGQIYTYNLYFQAGPVTEVPISAPNLKSAGMLRSASGVGPTGLGYGAFQRPSFATLPASLENVRLLHGSCRKPHAPGRDALTVVNGMIAATATTATARPHQLLLTGDQIYGDDVAAALLFMLTDAGRALGFANEALPGGDPPRATKRAERVRAAGITSDAAVSGSHLMTFAEYCCMYLFAWSDVLWQGNDFPDYTPVTGEPTGPRQGNTPFGLYNQDVARLRLFRRTLVDVRRALANVPTYMIFDDHEVTDDWFLDRAWVNNSVNNPLLRRMVQNGMSAYAACQGWGNAPGLFEAPNNGAQLLSALTAWAQAPSDATAGPLQNSLGMPTAPVAGNQEAFASEQPLIVIAPAPVAGFGAIEAQQLAPADPYSRDTEFWNARPLTFDRLLTRLATRAAPVAGTRSARIVLLSGDVHYGFAARLRYSATSPLESDPPLNTQAVFAQFTSSSFQNQSDGTLKLQSHPVAAGAVLASGGSLFDVVIRYGWRNPSGGLMILGTGTTFSRISRQGSPIIFERPKIFVPAPPGTPPNAPTPDWRYRIQYIFSDDGRHVDHNPPPTRVVPFPPPGDRDAALQAYLDSLADHTAYDGFWGAGKQIVGQNNVGEISFRWGAGNDKEVTQELWWWLSDSPNPFPLSRYRCSFSLAAEAF